MAAPIHAYVQDRLAHVRVCVCGKWPDHHVHTGDRMGCTCDECQELRTLHMHARISGTCTDCIGLRTLDMLGAWDVKLIASHIPISTDVLIDAGIVEDTRPVPPYSVPTRVSRVRLHASRYVTRLRRRLGSWIAGVDLSDNDRD
jgi:hypothetical protein